MGSSYRTKQNRGHNSSQGTSQRRHTFRRIRKLPTIEASSTTCKIQAALTNKPTKQTRRITTIRTKRTTEYKRALTDTQNETDNTTSKTQSSKRGKGNRLEKRQKVYTQQTNFALTRRQKSCTKIMHEAREREQNEALTKVRELTPCKHFNNKNKLHVQRRDNSEVV